MIKHINAQYITACERIILRTAKSEDSMVWQCERMEWYIQVLELLFTFLAIKVTVDGASLVVTSEEYQSEREFRYVGLRYISSRGVWYYPL